MEKKENQLILWELIIFNNSIFFKNKKYAFIASLISLNLLLSLAI